MICCHRRLGNSSRVSPQRRVVPGGRFWNRISSIVVRSLLHPHHLILATSIPPFASTSSSPMANAIISFYHLTTGPMFRTCGARVPTKADRSQFPPLTGPDAQACHQRSARGLQGPPEPVGRNSTRVQRGDDKMDEMDGESEIRNEFRPGDK